MKTTFHNQVATATWLWKVVFIFGYLLGDPYYYVAKPRPDQHTYNAIHTYTQCHSHIHAYTHTHIHTHIHTHSYIQ